MTENEPMITGAMLVALPGKIQQYIVENTHHAATNYSVYMWLDDDRALYLHGNTGSGRSSGSIQGKYADQIGSSYFQGLGDILAGESLLSAIQTVKSVQIDSRDVSWTGSMDVFMDLIGLVNPENIDFWKNAREYADRKMKETEGLERVKDNTE